MDLARFERATSTFAESRSDSTELQVRTLSIANCQLPSADFPVFGIVAIEIGDALAETERVERSRDFSRQVSNLLPYH
ncbi:MAG: hypothetical protein QOK48_2362 [Blastocatellia bacterium]|nr:hypothetical protein [Blastocatellia bacterium]